MIVRTRDGDAHVRAVTEFGSSRIPGPAEGVAGTGGISVTSSTMSGIPAVARAVQVFAQAVAELDFAVWRPVEYGVKRVTTGNQAAFFAGEPNDQQDRFRYWEAQAESLKYRANSYVWLNATPKAGVVEAFALHPDQVLPTIDVRGGIRYNVVVGPGLVDPVGNGFGFYNVGPDVMLHLRGSGSGGRLIAETPWSRFRATLASAAAKEAHEASMYDRGISGRLVVTFPAEKTRQQVQEWRDMWRQTYEGAGNAGKAVVVGGGATVTPIGLTASDAQFVESKNLSIADAARIVGVPLSLLDGASGGQGGESKPLSPEHEATRWTSYGLVPELCRIASAYRAHPAFAFSGADSPMFDVKKLIRGDIATEAMRLKELVQVGLLLADEGRGELGYGPLPDGAGQIPQIVPVGGGANPDLPPAAAAAAAAIGAALVRALMESTEPARPIVAGLLSPAST